MKKIKALQRDLNLKQDGIIGPVTFGALRMKWRLRGIELAHFLGQCAHETAGFRIFEENLRYSAEGLLRTFPTRYTPDLAKKHEYKPSVIANHVYGGRMGNTEPNDGWTFRGRGAIQLTGRNNYQAFADHIGDPSIMINPNLVEDKYCFETGLWFFSKNRIWQEITDLEKSTILTVSRMINMGTKNTTLMPNGWEDRIEKTIIYLPYL